MPCNMLGSGRVYVVGVSCIDLGQVRNYSRIGSRIDDGTCSCWGSKVAIVRARIKIRHINEFH